MGPVKLHCYDRVILVPPGWLKTCIYCVRVTLSARAKCIKQRMEMKMMAKGIIMKILKNWVGLQWLVDDWSSFQLRERQRGLYQFVVNVRGFWMSLWSYVDKRYCEEIFWKFQKKIDYCGLSRTRHNSNWDTTNLVFCLE